MLNVHSREVFTWQLGLVCAIFFLTVCALDLEMHRRDFPGDELERLVSCRQCGLSWTAA